MIFHDMSMHDYLKHPGLNSSKLKLMLKTALDFKEGCEEESHDTKSTILGTAIHTLLLEPKEFDNRYALQTEDFGDKRAGDGKKRWDAFKKANSDKIVLPKEETDFLLRLQKRKNPHLKLLLASGKVEVTGIYEEDRLVRKARADLLTKDAIVDVKSTAEGIDDLSIYRTIKKYHYDFSAAHYMTVFNKLCGNIFKNFIWVFVDTDSPAQHVRIIKCPEIMLNKAIFKYENVIEQVRESLEKNIWSTYPAHQTELEMPYWAEELK